MAFEILKKALKKITIADMQFIKLSFIFFGLFIAAFIKPAFLVKWKWFWLVFFIIFLIKPATVLGRK